MEEKPKSGAIAEAALATLGMLSGIGIGFLAIRAAYGYGWIATSFAFAVSVLLFFALMIGGSILGNYIRM